MQLSNSNMKHAFYLPAIALITPLALNSQSDDATKPVQINVTVYVLVANDTIIQSD